MVQARMEEKGVRFYLNDSAGRIPGNTARLQSGTELEFDVLVTAVGVRPNTQLVADAGGAVDRASWWTAAVPPRFPMYMLRETVPQGYDAVSGEKRMLPLWPNAVLQGETAGINMAGGRADYTQGIALNASACSACTWLRRAVMRARASWCRGTAATNALSRQTAFSGVIMVGGCIPRRYLYRPHPQEKAAVGDRL